jgi:hypothetical protein
MENGRDLYDFSNMSDEEVREVVLEHLREDPDLDADWIDVLVRGGSVTLSGRVGTDAEFQIAEDLVHDVLGIDDFSNDLVVDELNRGLLSESADEAVAEMDELDENLSETRVQQTDTAEHLQENLEEETFGTHDMGAAIRDGAPYVPPDRPQPGGYDSRENH